MFNLKEKATIFVVTVIIILILLGAGGAIINYFNQDTISHNVAVAVKAKEDLKNAVEINNKAQEEIVKLNAEIQERVKIENELKAIETENNKVVIESVEKIKIIDNTKIIYVEKPEEIGKSKVIIEEIWNVYNKGKGDKINENINIINK